MVGADICGFNGATTEELCARWIEVGAFYPFSRDHNAIGNPPQELYVWATVANISRNVLGIRYSLLPYYYTLFHHAHSGHGATVVRPLFFLFPTDSKTYSVDAQFLVGSGLLITPVVTQGATTVQGYFPNAYWYDYFTYQKLAGVPGVLQLDAPLEKVNMHIKGGVVIPTQQPSYTTYESRKNPFDIIVALDENRGARGDLFWDDGESLQTWEDGIYTYISFLASETSTLGSFNSTIGYNGYGGSSSLVLNSVRVLGVGIAVKQVNVNGKNVPFSFSASSAMLFVDHINSPLVSALSLTYF